MSDVWLIDEDIEDADWIKTLSWDLPADPKVLEQSFGPDWYEQLSKLPAWQAAPLEVKAARPGVMVKIAPGLRPVLKHGTHDQSSHGNWSHAPELSGTVASGIQETTRAEGGMSVSMMDGSTPPGGYMVARGRTAGVKPRVVTEEEFFDPVRGKAVLADFLRSNRATLTGGDYLGVWHEADKGKVHLDVAQNVPDRDKAVSLGRRRDQISIWDVTAGEEIETGGKGEQLS